MLYFRHVSLVSRYTGHLHNIHFDSSAVVICAVYYVTSINVRIMRSAEAANFVKTDIIGWAPFLSKYNGVYLNDTNLYCASGTKQLENSVIGSTVDSSVPRLSTGRLLINAEFRKRAPRAQLQVLIT
jgi:hypothetical protein